MGYYDFDHRGTAYRIEVEDYGGTHYPAEAWIVDSETGRRVSRYMTELSDEDELVAEARRELETAS